MLKDTKMKISPNFVIEIVPLGLDEPCSRPFFFCRDSEKHGWLKE